MRLYQKLVLVMLASAVAPVALLGFSLLGNAERELESRIAAQQATVAQGVAEQVGRDVTEVVESLSRQAERIGFGAMNERERVGAMTLLYHQSATVAAVGLWDRAGRQLATPVYRPPGDAALGDHPGVTAEDLAVFLAAAPLGSLESAPVGTAALSPPYVSASRGCAAAALLVAAPGADAPSLVGFELSLCPEQERVTKAARQGAGEVMLLDGEGRVLAGPDRGKVLSPASPEDRAVARTGGEPTRYGEGEDRWLAVAAPVPGRLGWAVLVRASEAQAFAPVARMRRTVLATLAVALALLLALGWLFTRRVGRALAGVAAGADAYAMGDLSVRVPAEGSDELADLGRAFNAMGSELSTARAKLTGWNEELRQKVEERTAELKRAQAQLVETQKLAAIGQLGAGVAHEINNPLAGILGHAQLMLLKRGAADPDATALKAIEAAARRARDITQSLLRFSEQDETADFRATDLNRVVTEVLSMAQGQLRSDQVEVVLDTASDLPAIEADAARLGRVVLALISNSRTAMKGRAVRKLTVSTRRLEGDVTITVADTGKGVASEHLPRIFEPFFTTKDEWSNVGLGLSVAYRVVQEHGGTIRASSQVGHGTQIVVQLPVRRPSGT